MRLLFDGFEIDVDGGRLIRDGVEVPLERRALDMLCYLAAHPSRLVPKEELVAEVWRARALSAGVLANTAAKLRKALGQRADARAPIETVHGRGYRFHARARSLSAQGAEADATRRPEPFVGRARVMEMLDAALQRAHGGQGQLVLIAGDAGIGKTRTLNALAERARARGFSVWEGAAYDGAGAPPYWPWVEVLRAARRELDEAGWARHLPAGCAALPRLVPELCAQAAPAADAQTTRFQLFDELARWLLSVSADGPHMIVIDDLHWADAATLQLLAHVAQALAQAPILFAASLREHDVALGAPRVALATLVRRARRVALRGLTPAEIAELLEALHGADSVDASCVEILNERTQGNPFFILQMLELLAQQGRRPEPASLRQLEAPEAVRNVIQQRLIGLPEALRDALAAAAVIGQEFDAGLLAELVGETSILGSLDVARRLGIVIQHGALPQRFTFGHALLRECLYAELGLPQRGALHARLVQLLAARVQPGDARRLGEVARHSLLAVPFALDACVAWCRRAADAARDASGFEAAAELLSRALERLLSVDGDARTGCELALSAGVDQYFSGDLQAGWQTLSLGAERARRLPSAGDLLARFVFRLLDCAEAGAGDESYVRALLEQALQALEGGPDDLRAALIAHRAEMACELPFAERAALLDEAERLAARHGGIELVLEVANCRAAVRDPTQAQHNLRAAEHLRELLHRHPASIATARRQLWAFSAELTEYTCALSAGDLVRVDAIAAAARPTPGAARPIALDLLAELMAAGRALGDGRLDALEARISQLRELSSQIPAGIGNVWLYYTFLLAEARGTLASLSALVPAELPSMTPSRNARSVLLSIAWVLLRLGKVEQARALLAEVPARELARMPVLYGDLGVLCGLVEAYAELDDRAGTERLYGQLAPHASANAVGPCLEYRGSVEHYLGLAASVLGRTPEALEHLARAQAFNERLNMPLQVARTHALRERLRVAQR
jgi:DNA-binding winged helix-turn-helix (wHTH) protein